jgi:hypothetical protein
MFRRLGWIPPDAKLGEGVRGREQDLVRIHFDQPRVGRDMSRSVGDDRVSPGNPGIFALEDENHFSMAP